MNLGERITYYRTKAGLSQTDLHKRSGVSYTIINRTEQNRFSPSIATLEPILKACNADLMDLFCQGYAPQMPEEERELHWKLSQILKGTKDERDGIALNINYIFGHMNEVRHDQTKKSTARKSKTVTRSLPPKRQTAPGGARPGDGISIERKAEG